ncbi:MAG: hypothetical protein WD377_08095 [Nitriliruptoraceae bacterium]
MMMLLAHAGAGSTWQAAVVVAALVLTVAVVLATFGVLEIDGPADLPTPIAVAVAAGAAGVLGNTWLSDGIGWALPLGVIALFALLATAFTPLTLTPFAPLAMGVLALAIVAPVLLYQPLTIAMHPPDDVLPLSDDSEVTIVEPADGARVTAGRVVLTVRVDGGSVGPGVVEPDALGSDPEEAGSLLVTVDGMPTDVVWNGCSVAAPCDEITFPITLDPGEHRITIEFTRGDGTPLAPYVLDEVTVTAQ